MSAVSNTSTESGPGVNVQDKKSVDVTAKLQECQNALKAYNDAAQLFRDLQNQLEDETFARALVERVAGPLPASVKTVKIFDDDIDDSMGLMFDGNKEFSWGNVFRGVSTNIKAPSELIDYSRRFKANMKHPDFVAWLKFTREHITGTEEEEEEKDK